MYKGFRLFMKKSLKLRFTSWVGKGKTFVGKVDLTFCLSKVLLLELCVEDWMDRVSDLAAWLFGEIYGTALFLPKSFCSHSSKTEEEPSGFWSSKMLDEGVLLRGKVLLKVRELVTKGDWDPLAKPLRTCPKFRKRSLFPTPKFSIEPLKGVEVLLTTPMFSETLREFPLLRWDKASNLQPKSRF